jgi:hypothetical protein
MSIFMVKMNQGNSRLGSGSLDYVARRSGTVAAASNTSPIVITSTGHNLVTGSVITIAGVGGNTAANTDLANGAPWTVTALTADTFSLNGSNGNGGYTSGGHWSATSIQMTMYAPGAKLTNRVLRDGEVFEDCNYWKQFNSTNLGIADAFIEVLEDDGIPFISGVTSYMTVVDSVSVTQGSGFSANVVNYLDEYGVPAASVSVSVTGDDIVMRINNSSSADLPISAGGSVSDLLSISQLNFSNLVSGGGTATVTVVATIPANCNS